MAFALPDRTTDSELDDFQSIELDIIALYNKFVLPIDNVRSFAAPTLSERSANKDSQDAVVNAVANTADYNPEFPQESRTHAFYRMIGFPVVSQNGEFYNPGFNPTLTGSDRSKNSSIAAKVSGPVKRAQSAREVGFRGRLATFSRQGIDAAIYALAIAVPNGTKPFLQMDSTTGFDSNSTFDPQQFSVKERQLFISKKYKISNGSEITNFFDSGSHILRPFNVDPNIVDTVTGYANETRHIAAPFLPSKRDTVIDRDLSAKRPAIEMILRLRLRQRFNKDEFDDYAISQLFKLDDSQSLQVSGADIKTIVSVLLNQTGLTEDDVTKKLSGASTLEVLTLNNLTKAIKGVVEVLVNSISNISNVSKKIQWTPLPGVYGPEAGTNTTNLIYPTQKTVLEKMFSNLSLRASLSSAQASTAGSSGILNSDFALSQYENIDKFFFNSLNEISEQIDNYQRSGGTSLAAIEIITGEICGLGLIDVLAIYTALWAIDIEALICMLDEKSFTNLYNYNVDLRTAEVEARHTTGPQMNIGDAMKAFEAQVISILSFSDRIFNLKLGSPVTAEGGDSPIVET